MAPFRDQIVERAVRAMLRQAVVTGIDDVNDSFRRLTVAAQAQWSPGDKVQLWIGGPRARTYTPFAWDDGSVSFLAYRHGPSPATTWFDQLAVGQALYFRGPRGSVDLGSLDRSPIFVGDETSFASAASWKGGATTHIFEVSDPDAAEQALSHLDLSPCTLVARKPNDDHHDELSGLVVDAVRRHPDAPLVLTGKAQSIKSVRLTLKNAGLSPTVRVKAYWDPNRSALD